MSTITHFTTRPPPMIPHFSGEAASEAVGFRTAPSTPPWTLINMNKSTESKPRQTKTLDPNSKKKLNMDSPKHRTPDNKAGKSPMDGKLSTRETRSQTKSGAEKKVTVTNSTFATTPTGNVSMLQASFLNRTGVSPLAQPFSDTEGDSDKSPDIGSSASFTKPKKSRCPCLVTSGGTSWLLTCSHCGQVWHSGCANLKGGELMDQSVIDAILVSWECPWCYTCPFPCPKAHKSAKLSSNMDAISSANLVSASVLDSLEGMLKVRFAEVTQPTNHLIDNIQKQLNSLSDQMKTLMDRPQPPHLPPPSIPLPDPLPHGTAQAPLLPRVEVGDTNLAHRKKSYEGIVENYITDIEEGELMNFLENEDFTEEGNRSTIQYGQH